MESTNHVFQIETRRMLTEIETLMSDIEHGSVSAVQVLPHVLLRLDVLGDEILDYFFGDNIPRNYAPELYVG